MMEEVWGYLVVFVVKKEKLWKGDWSESSCNYPSHSEGVHNEHALDSFLAHLEHSCGSWMTA